MTFLQIQCFARLVNSRRMNKTAKEFNIRPSTLTKYMQQLEDELNVKLFENTCDGFVLTPCGELIYPSMQFISHQYSTMLLEQKELSKSDDNTFKIVLPFHQQDIIDAIFDFKDANPKVSFQITELSNMAIQNAIYNADVDLGFGYSELMDKKLSSAYLAKKDEMVAVVSEKHPFAGERCISLSDLKQEKMYLFRDDELMYRYLLRLCIGAEFVPKDVNCNMRVNTMLWHVAQNHGVTLLPHNSVKVLAQPGCVPVKLKENYYVRMTMYTPNTYPTDVCIRLVSFIMDRFNNK